MNKQSSVLSITNTAEELGVSVATIRNWVRHKYLTPIWMKEGDYFELLEINSLRDQISNGEISRLNNRANKRNSNRKFVPKEYIEKQALNSLLTELTNYIIKNSLKIDQAIFLLSVNLLIREGLIFNSDLKELQTFHESHYKNRFLLNVFREFHEQLGDFVFDNKHLHILNFDIPIQDDILGLFYQSIKSEGDKAKQGSYYTPKKIVDEIISEHINEKDKILDPCCGTGQFLLNICKHVSDPTQLYGFDIDSTAVFISKINLILKYKNLDFEPQIFQKNTLLDIGNLSLFTSRNLPEQFDLIVTNPPWGLHFGNGTLLSLKTLYPQIKSLESFSYFLYKSIDLLQTNGVLSFILPESILNIKVHSDIRRTILEKASILKIVKLGRAFTNVFTNVVRIDLRKNKAQENHLIKIVSDKNYSVKQKRFYSNPDFIFDIEANDFDQKIIDKVYSKEYSTLKNNASWALGIVTGDNKKFLHSEKLNGFEEVYKGKDVQKYFLSTPANYINFEPEKFQQVAPIEKYRVKEKLIYKFISNQLVFAYDDMQRLTLNSANILIPHIKGYQIKIILALLNSSLYQFVYSKKFNTIKVLRGNLEELPFPKFSDTDSNAIISLVEKVLAQKIDYSIVDDLVFNLFGITDAEKLCILGKN
ncbi:MAG: N-6 DNA methylase [Ignavibacteriaceae bacterium]